MLNRGVPLNVRIGAYLGPVAGALAGLAGGVKWREQHIRRRVEIGKDRAASDGTTWLPGPMKGG